MGSEEEREVLSAGLLPLVRNLATVIEQNEDSTCIYDALQRISGMNVIWIRRLTQHKVCRAFS